MTVTQHKRTGHWVYDFYLNRQRYSRECLDTDGQRVTSRRAALAAEAEARRIAAIAPKLVRANDLTLAQVLNDLAASWKGTKQEDNKHQYARELLSFLKPHTAIRDIDDKRVLEYITHLRLSPLKVWGGGSGMKRDAPEAAQFWRPHPKGKLKSPGTVNRYLPLLRAVFARAYNTRDPITRERAIDTIPAVVDLKEPKRKARPVPDQVMAQVFDTLAEHAADAAQLTLYFGFRRNEVFTLTTDQIDQEAKGIRLRADQVKDNEDAFLPGSVEGMAFAAKLVSQAQARGVRHLITYRPYRKDPVEQEAQIWRPMKSPKRTWGTAMTAVEQSSGVRYRWHDIRAAFITRVALIAGPMAAQRLARHSDFETTRAYIEVSDDVMREGAAAAGAAPSLRLIRRKAG